MYRSKIILKGDYRKKKRNFKKFFLKVFLLLIFFCISGSFVLSLLVEHEIKEIKELKYANNYLRKKITVLKNNPQEYEKEIRRRLGYIKEGEKIVIYSERSLRKYKEVADE